MAEVLDPQVKDVLTINNAKTIGEVASHSMALAMQNAVSHQQAMNQLQVAAVGTLTKRMAEMDPAEAIGIVKSAGGNLGDQGTLIAALQQLVKGAQTTPPSTT